MNMIEVWQNGQIIALLPAEQHVELTLSTGKRLHVGLDGVYYREEIPPEDKIEVTYHED